MFKIKLKSDWYTSRSIILKSRGKHSILVPWDVHMCVSGSQTASFSLRKTCSQLAKSSASYSSSFDSQRLEKLNSFCMCMRACLLVCIWAFTVLLLFVCVWVWTVCAVETSTQHTHTHTLVFPSSLRRWEERLRAWGERHSQGTGGASLLST